MSLAPKTIAIIAIVGAGVLLHSALQIMGALKPMTVEGRADDTQRRKADAIFSAQQVYRDCLSKEGRPSSAVRISIPSQTGAPDVGVYEPARQPHLDCKGALDSQLNSINQL